MTAYEATKGNGRTVNESLGDGKHAEALRERTREGKKYCEGTDITTCFGCHAALRVPSVDDMYAGGQFQPTSCAKCGVVFCLGCAPKELFKCQAGCCSRAACGVCMPSEFGLALCTHRAHPFDGAWSEAQKDRVLCKAHLNRAGAVCPLCGRNRDVAFGLPNIPTKPSAGVLSY